MQFQLELPAGTTSYVDLALLASIANRRGYKQQNTDWAVAQFELFNPSASSTGIVSLQKLPETWVMDNAYTKSRALWDKMQDQVLDDQPSIIGAYHDFKIGMDADHCLQSIQTTANPGGRILTPQDELGGYTSADFTGAAPPRADWEFSQLTIPNDPATGVTTSYTMHAVGASTGASKGLIEGYAVSRSRPQTTEPNVSTLNGWMNELFDDGEQLDDLKDIIENENNRAPYPVGNAQTATEFYPGGPNELPGLQVHSFCNFTSTTVSQKNSISGGMFRNGLIKVTNNIGNAVAMIIHMLPGDHRGYMVEEC